MPISREKITILHRDTTFLQNVLKTKTLLNMYYIKLLMFQVITKIMRIFLDRFFLLTLNIFFRCPL